MTKKSFSLFILSWFHIMICRNAYTCTIACNYADTASTDSHWLTKMRQSRSKITLTIFFFFFSNHLPGNYCNTVVWLWAVRSQCSFMFMSAQINMYIELGANNAQCIVLRMFSPKNGYSDRKCSSLVLSRGCGQIIWVNSEIYQKPRERSYQRRNVLFLCGFGEQSGCCTLNKL